jgi:hypothetical protein
VKHLLDALIDEDPQRTGCIAEALFVRVMMEHSEIFHIASADIESLGMKLGKLLQEPQSIDVCYIDFVAVLLAMAVSICTSAPRMFTTATGN